MEFPNDDPTIPQLGMEFQTESEAWQFWMNYSWRVGFSARKCNSNKSRVDGLTTSMLFVCSKEGKRGSDKRDEKTKNPRAETRTDCKARLVLKLCRETNRLKVIDFVSDHNHLLQKPEACHLLRSQRTIPEATLYDIELADETGLPPKQTHELMGRQTGGLAHLTFTVLDHRNALRDKRQRTLISGEAVAMLNYFNERVAENPSFQHVEQVDEMQEITNIFWADAKMIAHYARFGEVVVFDTTFGTNKEHRPFGVFVGFNHFREMVIFGATIMYDQKIKSFEWVFKTFIEVHNRKKPKTIFTDQDIAMGTAIENVMPETTHGLCTWHIMENAGRHLMCYNKRTNILGKLSDCMYVYEEEAKFKKVFGELKEKINEDTWLPFIYKFKEILVYCYAVSLGIRSTQLNESINKDLKCYLKSDLNIIRLLKHFERIVNEKREKEVASDFAWRDNKPKIKVKVPILEQAGKLYTPKIFELFQDEVELSMTAQIEGPMGDEYMVSITAFGDHETRNRCYKVLWNQDDLTVSCGCKKFERVGILCWHALKVLDANNIKTLPEKYILKRWTKEAEDGAVEDKNGRTIIEDTRLDVARRSRDLCRRFLQIATAAAYAEEGATLVHSVLDALEKQVRELMSKLSIKTVDNHKVSPMPSSSEKFTMPPKLKKKEDKKVKRSSKRISGWTENMQKEGKKKGAKHHNKSEEQEVNVSNSEVNTAQDLPQMEFGSSHGFMELLRGCTDFVFPFPHGLEVMNPTQVGNLGMNLDLASHHQGSHHNELSETK